MSVIHERMLSGTSEFRHYHEKARQFFFILNGTATLEIAGRQKNLQKNEGAEVAPGLVHQMCNNSEGEIEFLVISQPSAKGDRVVV